MKRILVAVLLGFAMPAAAPAQSQQVHAGVTTHFSQGWPARLMASARAIGTDSIRDSLHWPKIEKVRGQYLFTDSNSAHVARACAAGMTVLLGIEPRNPLYDGGTTAYSPTGQAAFANYIQAIAKRYPGCVVAIEVGNEINGRGGMTGPAASNRYASHTALLKAVHDRVKPSHPGLQILGGSTNTIATGFLAKLFAAGALDYLDGVVVHPYRNDPEGVDREIGRLREVMVQAGQVKPIWATEFSRDFATPEDAAPFYIKMTSLMQGAGIRDHYWYALVDQKWFPTMGLLTLAGAQKPASRAFAFAAANLAPLGPARRIEHGDATLFHFRYGNGADVVWGGRRQLVTQGTPSFFRADGTPIAAPAEIGDKPVIILGASAISFGPQQIVADSLYGFAQAPLTWFARRDVTGVMLPLAQVDWQWTTYLGNPSVPNLAVNYAGIGPASRTSAVVRYTADAAASFDVSLCLIPLGTTGDGTTASLVHNGATLWSEPVGALTGKRTVRAPVAVRRGDTVDFVLSPNATPAGDRMRYRFRLSRSSLDAAGC